MAIDYQIRHLLVYGNILQEKMNDVLNLLQTTIGNYNWNNFDDFDALYSLKLDQLSEEVATDVVVLASLLIQGDDVANILKFLLVASLPTQNCHLWHYVYDIANQYSQDIVKEVLGRVGDSICNDFDKSKLDRIKAKILQ
eukprot:NODE_571_length_5897_cov_0.529148.p7 type:complete len:140 gc:universal NODE_571_length_5897_cov_0.529148:2715-2296(-)